MMFGKKMAIVGSVDKLTNRQAALITASVQEAAYSSAPGKRVVISRQTTNLEDRRK